MTSIKTGVGRHRRWAEFRLAVIGSLLANPPKPGERKQAIAEIAAKQWRHPFTGRPTIFSFATIERWYYLSRHSDNPVDDLLKRSRGDRGRRCIDKQDLGPIIERQYLEHSSWSKQLHFDNLAVIIKQNQNLGPMPSYPSLCRWMREKGLLRIRRKRGEKKSQAEYRARFSTKETRGFEAPYPGSLWHLDYHHARRKVLTESGNWITPVLLAILDDRSRLCCHMQWYDGETTDCLVHGFSQALQKRGVPCELLNDNGSAMTSAEFTEGLERISIKASTILPYCPEQNGKQERFFGTVEGRLMSMLEGKEHLTLKELNDASAAWMELDYNRRIHDELKRSPLDVFLEGDNIHRSSPASAKLAIAFTRQRTRVPRRQDSTLSIEGVRFELPWAYRHLKQLVVRYAEWNLSSAWLMDLDGEKPICQIFPSNPSANNSGQRRAVTAIPMPEIEKGDEISPLLREIMAEYAATGLPPAYLTKPERNWSKQ